MTLFITGNNLSSEGLAKQIMKYSNENVIYQGNKHVYKNLKFFRNLLKADKILIESINPSGLSVVIWIFIFLILKLLNKRVLLHWQGTDVTQVSRLTGVFLSKLLTCQVAQVSWLCEELKTKGIIARELSIPPTEIFDKFSPLPKVFSVLVYLGNFDGKECFYGREKIKKLAEEFKNIRFYIVGGNSLGVNLPNVYNLGWIIPSRMSEIYSKITVLLRITEHDGLSHMVLESLGRGRYVIWNKKYNHCLYADSLLSISTILKKLSTGKLKFNMDGQQYVEKCFGDEYVNKITKIYIKMLSKSKQGGSSQ